MTARPGSVSNVLRQVKVIIYRLKRNYGIPARIMVDESLDQNLQTGVITRQERVININRAIVVTPKMARDFAYDLSFIAANKNFTYGGFYDVSKRNMIVDTKDLPSWYVPDLNQRCVINGERYEIEGHEIVTGGTAYLLHLNHITNAPTEDIHEVQAKSSENLDQEIS